ncbi:Shikimate kinase [Thermobaculum terrenum ATCC BAA-798]|uniref:Shikimate kinase n=1 Tax=Thermobaculum terrenum (strain ATCC BAA-798 / CCMEE 7001 / YNP1) TaxID=525904 RepID=D1CDT1_THET1|nr:shikimate kinase [Thermobaculum terrenum]ACZ41087.1 Shikimate kinase [Thermobaculum terrenum ATCC BAA-798]
MQNVNSKHIVLIGLSGSGKSTVGCLLASKMGLPYIDTDREIEKHTGMPIEEIFSKFGEGKFRQLESDQINRALKGKRAVVSLGGGAVLLEENRKLIWDLSTVIWLQASIETIANRLKHTKEIRPLLAGDDLMRRLENMLQNRERYYSQAHLCIVTDNKSPYTIVEEILSFVR